jgi:hypothetical protein
MGSSTPRLRSCTSHPQRCVPLGTTPHTLYVVAIARKISASFDYTEPFRV